MNKQTISLNMGNGGQEMQELLNKFLPNFHRGNWQNCQNDGATLELQNKENLVFTTDSFVVDPIEFPGGNIGDLAFCGTVNDLVVMGAEPLGLSCALILEAGFPNETLTKIITTIQNLSKKYNIPIVTGDTKVLPKGAVDKIIINTSGIGITKQVLDKPLQTGDKIIISGGIGEHGIALLSKRFDFQTDIISDSKPLVKEMHEIKDLIKIAKDPTRGGLSACLNEIAQTNKIEMLLQEDNIPMQKSVKTAGELLGIDILELACEGRAVIVTPEKNADKVVQILQKHNPLASIVGEIKSAHDKGKVLLKTRLGTRILTMPSGQIVPRIC